MTAWLRLPLAACGLFLLTSLLLAQGNSAKAGKKTDDPPDVQWANLLLATKPSPGNSVNAAKGSNEQKVQIAAQAEKSRATAARAKDFYTKNPNHPNAPEARKLEAIAEMRGVKDGDTAHLTKAVATAKAFRENAANPLSPRVEVALAMDRLALSQKIKARTVADRPEEKENVADAVRAEFGHTAALHDYYQEVARGADMFTAQRIATNLLQWPVDAKIRREAQSIVDRHALLGKSLAVTLPSIPGVPVDLARKTGAVTVLFAWAPDGGREMLQSLTPWRSSLTPGVQLVYLALGGTAEEIATLQSAAPIKGRFCHQQGAAVAPTLRALKLTGLPYVYVLNRDGKLAGHGPVGELKSLLALARH